MEMACSDTLGDNRNKTCSTKNSVVINSGDDYDNEIDSDIQVKYKYNNNNVNGGNNN